MSNNKITTDEALELLVVLIRRLFIDKIPQMKKEPVKRRFEKELFCVLEVLSSDPSNDIEALPIWVQRLVYEMLTQYVMFYSLKPAQNLSIEMLPDMSDDDKIAAILYREIMPNSWPYPQSVPL
ncbi:MAG: hypothetical protein QNL62_13365 [Gammaproteobacteria bacterium]|nr:hypothetical protein [Gammaproteobacteria bacterium]